MTKPVKATKSGVSKIRKASKEEVKNKKGGWFAPETEQPKPEPPPKPRYTKC